MYSITSRRLRDRHAPPERNRGGLRFPLRALAYDLRKNLQQPLDELGWDWLRVGARTGDTTTRERAQQRRRPPHILVTTPESLTLLLSQTGWLGPFRDTRFLIADELHSLAENKRGVMLMVAEERLEELRISNFGLRIDEPAIADSPTAIGEPGPSSKRTDNGATGASFQKSGCGLNNPRLRNSKSVIPPIVRIGLSATVSPLERVAAFLVGPGRPA